MGVLPWRGRGRGIPCTVDEVRELEGERNTEKRQDQRDLAKKEKQTGVKEKGSGRKLPAGKALVKCTSMRISKGHE